MNKTVKGEVRAKILEASRDLIIERGACSASLFDIAERAGVSKGTLYYYFDMKDKLIMELAELHFSKLASVMYDWVDDIAEENPSKNALNSLLIELSNEPDARMHLALLSYAAFSSDNLNSFITKKYDELLVIFEVGALRLFGANADNTISSFFFTLFDGIITRRAMGKPNSAANINAFLSLDENPLEI
ncbi:MAG: TetR/AcrR family transcriptional regulator [Clostridia bacterium]